MEAKYPSLGMKDYYGVLGVEPYASKTRCNKAYYGIRHKLFELGHDEDSKEMLDVWHLLPFSSIFMKLTPYQIYEARDALTDDEERYWYNQEYEIMVDTRERYIQAICFGECASKMFQPPR